MTDQPRHRFDRLDADGDGFVTREDYLGVPRQLENVIGERNDGVTELETAYLALWARLCELHDGDKDGRLSRDEFVQATGDALSEDGYDKWIRPIVDAYIQALDKDGDGRLDAAELAQIGKASGLSEQQASTAVQLADTTGDGLLSADELHRLVRVLYKEGDPEAAASLLYNGIAI